jgi:hypothetical protein
MIAVSSFLSLGLVALLIMGLINNGAKGGNGETPINWGASLLVIAVLFLFWIGQMAVVALLLRNTPRSVQLGEDHLTVNGPAGREAEIPFASIILVRKADVPVNYWKYKASFRGLLIRYKDETSQEERDCKLSARDTNNFDELTERLFVISPVRRKIS